jgi:peptide/nickel transport system substrate-binding protein
MSEPPPTGSPRRTGVRLDHVVSLVLATLLAGIALAMSIPPAPRVGSSTSAPGPTPEPVAHVLREAVIGPVSSLDPLYARTRAERDIVALLFRGLTRLDQGSGLAPDLAASWSVTPDGLTYTFRLRRDARWHDGAPVTADDVVYTVLTLQHPSYAGPHAGSWRGVIVAKVDRLTVRFILSSPDTAFIALTTQPILPEHLLAGTAVAELPTSSFGRQPVGNGPFRLVSLMQDGAILERVPETSVSSGASAGATLPALPFDPGDWHAAVQATPGIDAIELTFVSNASALADAFRSGSVDAVGGLDPDVARGLATSQPARILRYPRTVLTGVVLNLRFGRTLFRSSHERRALLMAVDRDTLLDDVAGGMASRADSLVPPTSWAFDPGASPVVQYSRTAAAKELQAAGWRRSGSAWDRPGADGAVSFELVTLDRATNPVDFEVAQHLAAAWKVMGLRVTVTSVTAAEMVSERLSPGRFDAAIVDLNLGLEPDLYPLLFSQQAISGGSNIAGYQSTALDPLLENARKVGSAAARKKRLSALQAELAKELPILPLFYADYTYVMRNTVVGPVPREISSPSERFWDVITWRTAEPVGP